MKHQSIPTPMGLWRFTKLIGGLVVVFLCSCAPPNVVDLPRLPPPADAEIIEYEPGRPGGVFIQTVVGDISTLNPLVSEDASSGSAISMLLTGMTTWNPVTEEVEPALAKSWEIGADQRTFTFHLREGLVWSDGVPLTTDDVIFSYQCYYDERFPTRTRFFISINGEPCRVEKIDDLTMRITAPDIFAPFLIFVSGVDILQSTNSSRPSKTGPCSNNGASAPPRMHRSRLSLRDLSSCIPSARPNASYSLEIPTTSNSTPAGTAYPISIM